MIEKLILFVMLACAAFGQGSGVYNPPSQRDLVRAGAVLSSGGQATNLTVSGELTVSTVFSNRPAAVSGTEAGAFAGYYYYAGTDTLFGDSFTNEQGCTLYMDIECQYAGSWLLKSANGENILFFNGERWMYPLGELIDIEFSEIPFHGAVNGNLDAERGVSAGGVNIGSTEYLASFGVPAVTASGMIIAGDGSANKILTGGVISDVSQTMIVFGQNTASFTTNINPNYIGYYARVSSYQGYEGFSVVRAGATVSEDEYVFNVTPDDVNSVLPARFTGYWAAGHEGITTNCTFAGTNKLNIVGGIIVGINN